MTGWMMSVWCSWSASQYGLLKTRSTIRLLMSLANAALEWQADISNRQV